MKYEIGLLLAKHSTCWSSEFGKPSTVCMFGKSWWTQLTKVSSRRMLVKSESTSKLPIVNVGSCSLIFSENWKESLTMYLFIVKGFNIGTKNLQRLYVGIYKPNKIGWNGGQLSTCCLCTLQFPYIIPGLVPTGFTGLRISFYTVLESTITRINVFLE